MKSSSYLFFCLILTGVAGGAGCSPTLVIEDVNYAQPIESVLVPDSSGMVTDLRYGISFSLYPILEKEFENIPSQTIHEVHLIRNANGFYFITATNFRHVYVMAPAEGQLKQKKRILVSEKGIARPAFNWRPPYVELIGMDTDEIRYINENGILKATEVQP